MGNGQSRVGVETKAQKSDVVVVVNQTETALDRLHNPGVAVKCLLSSVNGLRARGEAV